MTSKAKKTAPSVKHDDLKEIGIDVDQYQVLTDWQHIDKRPDNYIGPMEIPDDGLELFVFDSTPAPVMSPKESAIGCDNKDCGVEETKSCCESSTGTKPPVITRQKKDANISIRTVRLKCPLALLNIFGEITQNAIDKSIKDSTTKNIKVNIVRNDDNDLQISVWNDGEGIPSYIHDVANVPVPTMLFGMTKTSDNYDDTEERRTGGRNGIGAKATNFFSKTFDIETYNVKMQTLFRQSFYTEYDEKGDRCLRWKPHKITKPKRTTGYTRVTYVPDLQRFGICGDIPDHLEDVLRSKVWDIAACTRQGVTVHLDGDKLPLKNFKHYVSVFSNNASTVPIDSIIADKEGNAVWNVGVLPIDPDAPPELSSGIDVGFVNGLRCCKGRHIDYVRSEVAKIIAEKLKIQGFTGQRTKMYCHVFCAVSIANPSFDSQTKTSLESQLKDFGFRWTPSPAFKSAIKKSGIIEHVESRTKIETEVDMLRKAATSTKLKRDPLLARTVVQVKKLRDASNAGRKGSMCTLILAEGDSAIGSVEPGLQMLGTDNYGLFPLKGKPINARNNATTKIYKNTEIHNVMLVLGLQYGYTYESDKEYDSLRYKKVWLMMDQDVDGSHICGLVYVFLNEYFPILVQNRNFVERFATPLMRAVPLQQYASRLDTKEFFSQAKYIAWMNSIGEIDRKKYDIVYLKGLATSDQKDMRRYMSDYHKHTIRLSYTGKKSSDAINLFLDDSNADMRKDVLRKYDPKVSVCYDMDEVPIETFLHNEFIHYSMDSVNRGIACAIDGLKESQRKVLYTVMRKNINKRVKVAQLAADVAAFTHYHHGEASLEKAIAKMAQEHPGSNNFNYLFPAGSFGSRSAPRDVHGQSRYIFTYMNPVTTALFPKEDTPVTRRRVDEEHLVEPITYFPVVPGILLNGANGVATGWSTGVYSYNPEEVFAVQRMYITSRGKKHLPTRRGDGASDNDWVRAANDMLPWYSMYGGKIEPIKNDSGQLVGYYSSGSCTIRSCKKFAEVHITELPVQTWTTPYLESIQEKYQFDDDASKKKKGVKLGKHTKEHSNNKKKFVLDAHNRSTNISVDIMLICDKTHIARMLQMDIETFDDTFSTPKDSMVYSSVVDTFSLRSRMSATNMNAFVYERDHDTDNDRLALKSFNDIASFFEHHGRVRLDMYEQRKAFIMESYSRELLKLESQLRYINEDIAGTINIKRKTTRVAYETFLSKGYPHDKLVTSPAHPSDRDLVVGLTGCASVGDNNMDEDTETKDGDDACDTDVGMKETFHYLLNLTHAFFTKERLVRLQASIDSLKTKLKTCAERSVWDMWLDDLDNLCEKYDVFKRERIERTMESDCEGKSRKGCKQKKGIASKNKAVLKRGRVESSRDSLMFKKLKL